MKKYFFILLLPLIFIQCSSSVNTANMSVSEHYDYAKRLFDKKDYIDAINEFQSILLQYPGNPVTDDAQFYLAQSHFKKREYILAAYEYSRLIKNMPASELVDDAQFMLAEAYYELAPRYQLDQRYTKKAIEEFQAFIDFFPTNEKVKDAENKIKELNDRLAEKEFKTAELYKKMQYLDAAVIYYNLVSDNFHDSKFAPVAMYNKIKILLDKKENEDALRAINAFIQRFPNDPNISEVKKYQQNLTGNS